MVIPLIHRPGATLGQKLSQVRWLFVALIAVVTSIGGAMLFSAADGNVEPWAIRHMVRFAAAFCMMLFIAVVDIRLWLRQAYLIYAVAFALLVAVEAAGTVGMGAQRWIDLGVINLQPSEVMKIALVLALARYFHGRTFEDVRRPLHLIVPFLMVALPAALVLKQPDLGTAVMLIAGGGAVFFAAGVPLWMFGAALVCVSALLPVAWQFLHDYQQRRVLTFLDPENDPLGAGYHILQSKIALGSGGLLGKGYMLGTQSQLNFLPEKQTDFIFTMFAEEFGLIGALTLLLLYAAILAYGFEMALSCRNQFGRLLALGITTAFFLYVFINMAMVMGLIPVVGVPLPLVSYGGTAILTLHIGFGLILSAYIHRDVTIGRHGAQDLF